MTNTKKIRLLAVEDSGYMLMALRAMVRLDPGIEIVGEARNGIEGVAMARDLAPDVVTMDINMPELNGIEATRQIMAAHPMPIITLSSMTERGKAATAQAFEAGAVDFIPKSMSAAEIDLATITQKVAQKIRFWGEHTGATSLMPPALLSLADLVVCVGGVGAPLVVASALRAMPERVVAPILVSIDTLPVALTEPFVDYLGRISNRPARIAAQRGLLAPGEVVVIPGGRKAGVERVDGQLVTLLNASPAPDLMASAARAASRPHFIVLSGGALPLAGFASAAFEKQMIVALQDPSTCLDHTLVEAVQRSGIPYDILQDRSEVKPDGRNA